MIRAAVVEAPDGLMPAGTEWDAMVRAIVAEAPDLLVMNEMPFGPWIAARPGFDSSAASAAVVAHDAGIAALAALGLPAIVTSRPVAHGDHLVNEAVLIAGGVVTALHRKQLFPEEPGWHEQQWFSGDASGYRVHDVAGVATGVLLCTELMANERARAYGQAGAELIVVPRATDRGEGQWQIAGAMAAIVSGCYVLSANRSGQTGTGPEFGGGGFAFDPQGQLLGETGEGRTVATVSIDPARARAQKSAYPVYVFGTSEGGTRA